MQQITIACVLLLGSVACVTEVGDPQKEARSSVRVEPAVSVGMYGAATYGYTCGIDANGVCGGTCPPDEFCWYAMARRICECTPNDD